LKKCLVKNVNTFLKMNSLIWWVPFCAGGFCDRLLGMVSSYCLAQELGRHFLIKWDRSDFSQVLTINPDHDFYTYNFVYTMDMKDSFESQSYFAYTDLQEKWKNINHVLIWGNFNIFYYYCLKRPEIAYQEKFSKACKIIFEKFLFPIPEVYSLIPEGIELATGIHIRTHDNQFGNIHKQREQIPYISDILTRVCKHSQTQLVFISSDCPISHSIAKQHFSTVLETKGDLIHSDEDYPEKEGLVRVVADLISLSRCKLVYLGWNTNYSRFGALLNSDRVFYSYEHPTAPLKIISCDFNSIANYFSYSKRGIS